MECVRCAIKIGSVEIKGLCDPCTNLVLANSLCELPREAAINVLIEVINEKRNGPAEIYGY